MFTNKPKISRNIEKMQITEKRYDNFLNSVIQLI